MKFYLCSSFARHAEMCEYQKQLGQIGHEVTSQWHSGEQTKGPDMQASSEGCSPKNGNAVYWAEVNFEDIKKADALVMFSSSMAPNLSYGRGGRFTELGYALAKSKRVLIIGEGECIFQALVPEDFWFVDWEDFIMTAQAFAEKHA
jgi:nucleoside 2-deoxyribosyltransferase